MAPGGKSKKQTRKFVKNHLKRTIEDRKKRKDIRDKIERKKGGNARAGAKGGRRREEEEEWMGKGKGKAREEEEEDAALDDIEDEESADESMMMMGDGADESDEESAAEGKAKKKDKYKGMSVDDFLSGGFMDGEDEGEESEEDDADSFADVDDLDGDEQTHKLELAKLAEKDPEFYKYLQENDQELLEFGDGPQVEDLDSEDEMEEGAEEESKGRKAATVLTKKMLSKWQKGMLEHRSLRGLRQLLLAFRSAAHMDEDEFEGFAYAIDSPQVFNKLVLTTLKYTPIVLAHHVPYKELPNGKFKLPTQSPKYSSLSRLVESYFSNLLHLLRSLPSADMQYVAVQESAKMVPWVVGSRRAVREYLKLLLDLWSSAADNVRIAAFLAIRRVAAASEESIMDLVLKGIYHAFVRSTKLTTVHTLPSINLMKNSASEIYAMDLEASYRHAFGFIRQLAIHLRNSLKLKSKDAYKAVYNWQFVHSIDFWSIVLASTCDKEVAAERGSESPMHPLIYPLVQVTLGVVRLIPTSRYWPLRFHCVRAMLRLVQRTGVYIPLASYLFEVLESSDLRRKPKAATLKPLDLEYHVRAPAQYLRTRVYVDVAMEEMAYLLLEFFATQSLSIAFPELALPAIVFVKRSLKRLTAAGTANGKLVSQLKSLADKLQANSRWIEEKRAGVEMAPADRKGVDRFLEEAKVEETPLGHALKLSRKLREQKRKALETGDGGKVEAM